MPLVTDAEASAGPIPMPRTARDRMALITDALAGEGTTNLMTPTARDQMPRVTTALAGEGPRDAVAEYHAHLADAAARMTPEGMQHLDVAAPFLLPAAQSYRAAFGINAGYQALTTAVRELRDGIEPDWRRVGKAALVEGLASGVAGAATHGATKLLFGAPDPERRAAEAVLGMPGAHGPGPRTAAVAEDLRYPQTDLSAPASVRAPVPVTPAGRTSYGKLVDDALVGQLPEVSRPAVNAAYDGFRQEVGGRAIDVTAYNRTLQHYADVRFPRTGLSAPARYRPSDPR
jgi:hypothetical protein